MTIQPEPPVDKEQAIACLRQHAKSANWKESTIASYVRTASLFFDWRAENKQPLLPAVDQDIKAFCQFRNQVRLENRKKPLNKKTTDAYRTAIGAAAAANTQPQLSLEQGSNQSQVSQTDPAPPAPKLSDRLFQLANEVAALEAQNAQLQRQQAQIQNPPQVNITPEKAMANFRNYGKERKWAKTTFDQYVNNAQKFVDWCIENQHPYLNISKAILEEYKRHRSATNAPSTLNNIHFEINHFLAANGSPTIPK